MDFAEELADFFAESLATTLLNCLPRLCRQTCRLVYRWSQVYRSFHLQVSVSDLFLVSFTCQWCFLHMVCCYCCKYLVTVTFWFTTNDSFTMSVCRHVSVGWFAGSDCWVHLPGYCLHLYLSFWETLSPTFLSSSLILSATEYEQFILFILWLHS
jgi:hypothetical protein